MTNEEMAISTNEGQRANGGLDLCSKMVEVNACPKKRSRITIGLASGTAFQPNQAAKWV